MEKVCDLQIFYNRLTSESKGIVNASVRGFLKEKSMKEVRELFQRMAKNGCAWSSDRRVYPKASRIS